MANHAELTSSIVAYRTLRELGTRMQRCYAAVREPSELVVLHKFAREKASFLPPELDMSAETLALLLRDARCLAKNWHPNIARVKHADLVESELSIATELVEGVTLEDLFALARNENQGALPLPAVARIVVDVLTGLHAFHGLRDGIQSSLGLIHGEVCPANVVVGKDGVARIVNTFRPRPVRVLAKSEALPYAAAEALDVDGTSDCRSDVYAVGAILWECLTGKRLYEERDPLRILHRQRREDPRAPSGDGSPEFTALADVAMRALSFDPARRYKSAAEMAMDLRRRIGPSLAAGNVVAQLVARLGAEKMRARKAELDPSYKPSMPRVTQALPTDHHDTLPPPPPADEPPPATLRGGNVSLATAPLETPAAAKPPAPAAAKPAAPRAGVAPPLPPRATKPPALPSKAPTPLPLALRLPTPLEVLEELPGPRASMPDILDPETAALLSMPNVHVEPDVQVEPEPVLTAVLPTPRVHVDPVMVSAPSTGLTPDAPFRAYSSVGRAAWATSTTPSDFAVQVERTSAPVDDAPIAGGGLDTARRSNKRKHLVIAGASAGALLVLLIGIAIGAGSASDSTKASAAPAVTILEPTPAPDPIRLPPLPNVAPATSRETTVADAGTNTEPAPSTTADAPAHRGTSPRASTPPTGGAPRTTKKKSYEPSGI